MIIGNSKGVNNRHVRFGSITSSERAVMDTVLIWLPHRKCTYCEILIGHEYYVKHLNKNIFSGSSSTTNELNFKIVCNCIHELLNVLRIRLNVNML